MGRRAERIKDVSLTLLVTLLVVSSMLTGPAQPTYPLLIPTVRAQTVTVAGSVTPTSNALLVNSTGNVRVVITRPGIAVRIEVPREFLQGVVSGENDTHFITSNIRNDYYYYNVVDESIHWTYNWQDNASDGPCFKPGFSYYDANAPYCIEIWNYLNPLPQPFLKPPQYNITCCAGPGLNPAQRYTFDYSGTVGVDYCQFLT